MLNLILLLALVFCETGYAKATNQPKPLWEKEFKTEIDSVAMSKDGKRIAVIVEPEIKDYKNERYYSPAGEDIRREWFGSKLYYLDNKGKILWKYEAKKMHKLGNVVMSDKGDYIVCCLMKFITENREIEDEIKKWQEGFYAKVLFFNSTGKLLWSFNRSIDKCQISSDGNYIFLIPDIWDGATCDDFYLLNKDGKVLCKILSGERLSSYKMTKDAKRIIIGNALYDRNGNVLWKLKEGIFTEITEDGSYGIVEIPIYPWEPRRNCWKTFLVVDLNKKKVLWGINEEKIETPPYGPILHIASFEDYFIYEPKKYLLTLSTDEFPNPFTRVKKGEVKIYDLKTGKLIKKSLDSSEYYNYKELYQTQGRKYKVEKKENILYYYSLEGKGKVGIV